MPYTLFVCVSMSQTITLLPHSCHRTGVMDRAITVLHQMWHVLESSPLTMIHNDCNPHNICPRRAPIPTVTMEGALPIPAVHTTSPSLAAPHKVQTQNPRTYRKTRAQWKRGTSILIALKCQRSRKCFHWLTTRH